MIQLGLATEKAASIPALLDSFRIGSYIGERIMNYQRIYNEFIADRKAKAAAISGYSEKHHILPRALGGGDDQDNLVRLTPEDHVRAHLLLAKIHGGSQWYAVSYAIQGNDARKVPTRVMINAFGMARRARATDQGLLATIRAKSLAMWEKPEHRAKMAAAMAEAMPQIAAKLRENFKDPAARHAAGNGSRGRVHAAEERLRRGAAISASSATAEARAKRSSAAKKHAVTPEGREAKRRASNARWDKVRAAKAAI